MSRRALGFVVVAAFASVASAEPKPTAVDIKPFKDKLIVLTDAAGGVYVTTGDIHDPKIFYGNSKSKILYEQVTTGGSSNEDAWDIDTWSPRLTEMHPGVLQHKQDGSYQRYCWGADDAGLSQLTGDKAKAVLDGYQFQTTAMVHQPHLFARDDSGVYYYIDVVRPQYGGNGYRVFIGKRGAMKQVPLTDVASDTGGEVFSTKNGDLRLVAGNDPDKPQKRNVVFVKGDKKTDLTWLDLDANSRVIFKDLGIYDFLGSLCENV